MPFESGSLSPRSSRDASASASSPIMVPTSSAPVHFRREDHKVAQSYGMRTAGSLRANSFMNPIIGNTPRTLSPLNAFASTKSERWGRVSQSARWSGTVSDNEADAGRTAPTDDRIRLLTGKGGDASINKAHGGEAKQEGQKDEMPAKSGDKTILEGYLWGQIANVVKAGLWWVSFNPLVLAVFRGNSFGVGACRVAFNLAMLLFSPIAGVVADRYSARFLLLLTTFMRGAIYVFLVPLSWLLLSSGELVDDSSNSRVVFYVIFVLMTFLDGAMVAFGNVLDIDQCGADMVAIEHNVELDDNGRNRLNAIHIGWMDASMVLIAPGMGAIGWYVSEKDINDVAVVLGIIASGFLVTSILSAVSYLVSIPSSSSLKVQTQRSVIERLMDRIAEQPFMSGLNAGYVLSDTEIKSMFDVYDHAKTGRLKKSSALLFYRELVTRIFVSNQKGGNLGSINEAKTRRESVVLKAAQTLYEWTARPGDAEVPWEDIGPNNGVTCAVFSTLFMEAMNGFRITWSHTVIRWRMLFFVLETAFEDAMISLIIAEYAIKGVQNGGNYAKGNFLASLIVAAGKFGGMLMTCVMRSWNPAEEGKSFLPLFICVFLGAISTLLVPFALKTSQEGGEGEILSWVLVCSGAFLFFFFSTAPKVGFATLMQSLAVKSTQNPAVIFGSIAAFVTTIDSIILMSFSFIFSFLSLQSALWISCAIIGLHGVLELLVGPWLVKVPKEEELQYQQLANSAAQEDGKESA